MKKAFYWIPKRVYWPDTDPAGIVYFANYFRYFEEVEDELFRALGHPRDELLEQLSIFMPRVESHCRFKSPARTGALLLVGVRPDVVNPRRVQFTFEVRHSGSDAVVAEASYRVACTTREFEPTDFPQQMLDVFSGVSALARAQGGRANAARQSPRNPAAASPSEQPSRA